MIEEDRQTDRSSKSQRHCFQDRVHRIWVMLNDRTQLCRNVCSAKQFQTEIYLTTVY